MLAVVVASVAEQSEAPADFDAIYRSHFAFVWRCVRRLGIAEPSAEDVAQEVFVIVHRRLDRLDPGASVRAWLFGIVRGVVANARRSAARQRVHAAERAADAPDPSSARQPHAQVERAEAVRILYEILGDMDDDKREVFILAELEQMATPEIADALGINLNTTYSRVRAARRQFKEAVARRRARERRRT